MLQNRVNPFGDIIRTAARGSLMGNRGVIHNERKEIVRTWRLKAWIACVLEFKGRWRKVMTTDRWTELFFFDEATAFAAGHRPCFECRRADAVRFKQAWIARNPEYQFHEKTPIGSIDEVLHRERIAKDGAKLRHEEAFHALPNGSFIDIDDAAWLVWDNLIYKWTPEGYSAGVPGPGTPGATEMSGPARMVSVLTPRSVVRAFRAGYVPAVRLALSVLNRL